MANEVKYRLAVDGAGAVVSEFARVLYSMEKLTDAGSLLKSAMGSLAAGLSVTAVVAWGRATLDAADAMNDLSQRVGISVKDLAKYELAAAQSGTTMEALAKGIKGIAGNLQEHGAALKKAGIDATTADGAMQQLADVFAGMPDGMDKTTLAVKLFGKSGMDLIPMLNLGSEGLKTAAEKSAAYAEQMAVMAPLADAFNDSLATLTLQSKVSGLVFLNEMLPSLTYVSAAMADADKSGTTLASTFGQTIGTAFEAAVLIASDVIFVFKGVGREIGGIFAQINALNEGGGAWSAKGRAAWTAVGDAMKDDAIKAREDLDRWQENLVSRTKNTGTTYNQRQGFGESLKSDTAGLALLAALGNAGKTAKEAISEATKGLNLYLELMDKGAGFEKTWAKDANELRAALDAKAISQSQYNAAVDQLLKKQPLMVEAEKLRLELAKENTKAVDALFEAQEKQRLGNEDQIKTTRTLLEQIEFETRLLGLNAEQRAIATMERELEAKGIIKGTQAYDAYIAKLREALSLKVGKEEGLKAADDLAKASQKAAEESAKYWEDALMRAFESGKGFFESLWDTIKNTLKTQVLKVTVQGVMGSLGIGAAGAAMAGDTGGGNLLGVAGNLSSLYNTATSGIAASVGVVGNAAVASIQGMIGMTGTAAQAATAAANGVAYAATGSGSMLASIGAAAPYALAAVAAVSLIKGLFSESREITAQGTQGTFSGAAFAGQNYTTTKVDPGFFSKTYHTTDYSAMDAKTAQAWTDAFAVLKTGAANAATTLGLATDQITAYSKVVDIAAGTTQEQMTALFTGMADDMATAVAPGLDALAKVGETSSTTLSRLSGSISTVNTWLGMLRNRLYDVSLSGADAASKLADAFGGLDQLAASSKAYYEAYYTEAERTATSNTNLAKAMALVNVALPATKEAFREVVSGLDLTTESGRNAYAVMLALAPEFASVADAATASAQKIADANKSWQDKLAVLLGTQTERTLALRDAADDSTRALMQQVYAQEDLVTAADAASEAYKALATAVTSSLSAAVSEAEQALASAKEALQAAYSAEASALKATQDRFAGIFSSFRDFADSLAGAIEAPAQSVERLQAEYARLSDLARLGDSGAASKSVSVGAQLKDSIVSRSATGTEAALALARLQASALATAGIADQQASIAKQSLDALTAQASALVTLNTSVLSVKDAVAAFQSTQTALDTARNAYLSRLGSEISVAISDGINGGSLKKSVDALTEGFTGFDTNKSGGITLDELTAAMGKTSTKDQIAALFDAVDINRNGTIDQIDLLKSAIAASALATMDLAKNAYFNNATIGAGQVTTYSNGATAVKNADGTATFHGMGGQTEIMAITDSLKDLATRIPELAAIWKHDYGIDLNPSGAVGGSATTGASLSASEQFAQTHAAELAHIQGFADAYFANSDPVGMVTSYANGATATRTAKDFAQFSGVGGQVATMAKGDTILELAKRIPELRGIWFNAYGLNIPAFAKGTNYLPSDMLIQAHAGERIFPAADNRELMQRLQSPQANNEALISEIRALRQEVAGLRAEARATATNTNKTAKLLDRAMPDGDALATRAAA